MTHRRDNPALQAAMYLGRNYGWSDDRCGRLAMAWKDELEVYDSEEVLEAAKVHARNSEYMPKLCNMLDLLRSNRTRDLSHIPQGCVDCLETGRRHLAWHRTDENDTFQADTFMAACDCEKGQRFRNMDPWHLVLRHWETQPGHIEAWVTDRYNSKLSLEAQIGPARAQALRSTGGANPAGSPVGSFIPRAFKGQP